MKQSGKVYKVIFLDRDGVVNKCINIKKKCYAPTKFKDFKIYPYVSSSLKLLKQNNFLILVITNQPDIGKKVIKLTEIQKMNNLLYKLGVDDIYICPHTQKSNCACRKPGIGLINKIKQKYNINFQKSYLIGDRISDMLLAEKIKCKPLFIDRNYLENQNYNAKNSFYSIRGATKYILSYQ